MDVLLLVAAIALVAYGVGYSVGRLDERRERRRARPLRDRLAPYVTVDELEELRRGRRN